MSFLIDMIWLVFALLIEFILGIFDVRQHRAKVILVLLTVFACLLLFLLYLTRLPSQNVTALPTSTPVNEAVLEQSLSEHEEPEIRLSEHNGLTPEVIIADVPPVIPPVPSPVTTSGSPILFVPGGCFTQGTSLEKVAEFCSNVGLNTCSINNYSDETPEHNTCLSSFYIDQFEVTQNAYSGGFFNHNDYPVWGITWREANDYCRSQNGYLPTEAQWEYAARGTAGAQFAFNTPTEASHLYLLQFQQDTVASVNAYSEDVSWVGAYHMGSNVREWVNDYYDPEYYSRAPENNPLGPEIMRWEEMVVKGGSWSGQPEELRFSNREGIHRDNRLPNIGFRCAYPASP